MRSCVLCTGGEDGFGELNRLPLHFAARNKTADAVAIFAKCLEGGPDGTAQLKLQDRRGETPLHLALGSGNDTTAALCIENLKQVPQQVSAVDSVRCCALASLSNHRHMSCILLEIELVRAGWFCLLPRGRGGTGLKQRRRGGAAGHMTLNCV